MQRSPPSTIKSNWAIEQSLHILEKITCSHFKQGGENLKAIYFILKLEHSFKIIFNTQRTITRMKIFVFSAEFQCYSWLYLHSLYCHYVLLFIEEADTQNIKHSKIIIIIIHSLMVCRLSSWLYQRHFSCYYCTSLSLCLYIYCIVFIYRAFAADLCSEISDWEKLFVF